MNKYVEQVIQKRIDELEEERSFCVSHSDEKVELSIKEEEYFLKEFIEKEKRVDSWRKYYPIATPFEDSLDKITSDIVDLLVRKNANYGNSFDRQMDEYGMIAAVIRLDDKMSRLRALTKGEQDKVGESVDDTLRDIVGYTLLTLNWIANQLEEEADE